MWVMPFTTARRTAFAVSSEERSTTFSARVGIATPPSSSQTGTFGRVPSHTGMSPSFASAGRGAAATNQAAAAPAPSKAVRRCTGDIPGPGCTHIAAASFWMRDEVIAEVACLRRPKPAGARAGDGTTHGARNADVDTASAQHTAARSHTAHLWC
jgi:hypothetical protein